MKKDDRISCESDYMNDSNLEIEGYIIEMRSSLKENKSNEISIEDKDNICINDKKSKNNF